MNSIFKVQTSVVYERPLGILTAGKILTEDAPVFDIGILYVNYVKTAQISELNFAICSP